MAQAPTIDNAALDELARGFRGKLLRPGDDGYDAARTVFNAMIDRHPPSSCSRPTPPPWRRP